MDAPMINGRPVSPVHYSRYSGVHTDIGLGPGRTHIPFYGQTTLQTFRIGGKPSYANDKNLADLGGECDYGGWRKPKER